MRSLKTILLAASVYKTKSNQTEENIAVQVLEIVNVPKFVLNDIPIYKSIISDLFPKLDYKADIDEKF